MKNQKHTHNQKLDSHELTWLRKFAKFTKFPAIPSNFDIETLFH